MYNIMMMVQLIKIKVIINFICYGKYNHIFHDCDPRHVRLKAKIKKKSNLRGVSVAFSLFLVVFKSVIRKILQNKHKNFFLRSQKNYS
jgi:hypothetical protein